MSGRVFLVADGAPEAGLGHLARSSALAQALAELGAETVRTALGAAAEVDRGGVEWAPAAGLDAARARPSAGDVVVVDGYGLDAGAVRRYAGAAPVVWFWDEGEAPPADLVVTVALEPPTAARALAGPEYACLGRDYWRAPERRTAAAVERVLVAAGGSDPTGAAPVLCDAARRGLPAAEVVLVAGPNSATAPPGGVEVLHAPPSLRRALVDADVAITAAGHTMLEALASGTPCVAVPVAPNQRPAAGMLARRGAVLLAERDDPAGLDEAVARIADAAERRALTERGMGAVDGRGALRVAEEVARLASRAGGLL